MNFSKIIIAALASAGMAGPVLASPYTVNSTTFKSGPSQYAFDEFVWGRGNPSGSPELQASFRGQPHPSITTCWTADKYCSGPGCISELSPSAAGAYSNTWTGMVAQHVYLPKCNVNADRGDSFIGLSNAADGGISTYVRSGKAKSGTGLAFMQAPTASDPDAINQGVYIPFTDYSDVMRPFAGAGVCTDQACRDAYKLQMATKQGHHRYWPSGNSGGIQVLRMVFKNVPANTRMNIAFRTWCVAVSGSCRTRIDVDPNQGSGQAYVAAQLGPKDTDSTLTVSKPGGGTYTATVMTNIGNGETRTGSASIPQEVFKVTISWKQFITVLRAFAYTVGKDGSSNSGVAAVFGSGWNGPDNWSLSTVRYGQELFDNKWKNVNSYSEIGGSMNYFNGLKIEP